MVIAQRGEGADLVRRSGPIVFTAHWCLMAIRCATCSEINLPDANGRKRPWCSKCGADLTDTGTGHQAPSTSAPVGNDLPVQVLRAPVVSNTPQPRKPDSPWVILVIGLVIFGLGVAVVVNMAGEIVNGVASRSWPKTQGTLVRSYVEEWRSNRGGRSYNLVAIYRYEVDGKPYENDRISFARQQQAGDRAIGEQELAKVAPSGKPCAVYYDPSDPKRSCLVPGSSLFYLVFLPFLSLVFLLVGGVCTWGSANQILGGKKPAVASNTGPAS